MVENPAWRATKEGLHIDDMYAPRYMGEEYEFNEEGWILYDPGNTQTHPKDGQWVVYFAPADMSECYDVGKFTRYEGGRFTDLNPRHHEVFWMPTVKLPVDPMTGRECSSWRPDCPINCPAAHESLEDYNEHPSEGMNYCPRRKNTRPAMREEM